MIDFGNMIGRAFQFVDSALSAFPNLGGNAPRSAGRVDEGLPTF